MVLNSDSVELFDLENMREEPRILIQEIHSIDDGADFSADGSRFATGVFSLKYKDAYAVEMWDVNKGC
jgi:hypothetical protein